MILKIISNHEEITYSALYTEFRKIMIDEFGGKVYKNLFSLPLNQLVAKKILKKRQDNKGRGKPVYYSQNETAEAKFHIENIAAVIEMYSTIRANDAVIWKYEEFYNNLKPKSKNLEQTIKEITKELFKFTVFLLKMNQKVEYLQLESMQISFISKELKEVKNQIKSQLDYISMLMFKIGEPFYSGFKIALDKTTAKDIEKAYSEFFEAYRFEKN